MTEPQPLLELRAVTAGYAQDIDVLRDIRLRVDTGQITGLIGLNGAGKSTLVKTICGFLPPKAGQVLFDGQDIRGIAPHRLIELSDAFGAAGYALVGLAGLVFVGIFASLAFALYFMLKDGRNGRAKSGGMARALTFRIGLSVFLFLCMLLAWKLGYIQPTGLPVGK